MIWYGMVRCGMNMLRCIEFRSNVVRDELYDEEGIL